MLRALFLIELEECGGIFDSDNSNRCVGGCVDDMYIGNERYCGYKEMINEAEVI